MQRTRDLVIYGAGGHAAVILDALLAGKSRAIGFLDDGKAPGTEVLGVTVLGGFAWLEAHPVVDIALGIGDNSIRRNVAERCLAAGVALATVVHPAATVSAFASLGPGTVVMAGAVVNARARVGRGCIVNSGAVIEHDVVLGDFSHAAPNSTLTGAASIGEETLLGAGACVLPGISVGARCVIGAGAVVNKSVSDDCTAVGVPARSRHRTRSGRG